ncbi:MAG: hypothetical protein JO319_20760 [Acidobacteriaceae bacterium]|nr:hypothetical protein [Acidobacteriaceae bacterium]
MSQASPTGFTVSGKWRQQFDWAVVEWNRDNVFEHPALRYLPDGDLSGLVLNYRESCAGCIPIQSNLVPIVAWDSLRIWATPQGGSETVYSVPLAPLATPVAGEFTPASATMTLTASPGVGQRVGLALLEQQYSYTVQAGDQLPNIAAVIASKINQASQTFSAANNGSSVTITWNATAPGAPYSNLLGANGNRITVYGFAERGVAVWQEPAVVFSGGAFPAEYQITIDFGSLQVDGVRVPTNNIRKMRWTWAADLQNGSFKQSEFQVSISQWTVTGNNRAYRVAGPGSRRIEDTDSAVVYSGTWSVQTGSYSGSKIHLTTNEGDSCTIRYSETATHELLFGTRMLSPGASLAFALDSQPAITVNLDRPGEDVLIRVPVGTVPAGAHTLTCTHAGPPGSALYFDFLEIAYPSPNLPEFPPQSQFALATDWDTYHSQSLPAERTAWLVNALGYQGRLNHYAGALWFYELVRSGTVYGSAAMTFTSELIGVSVLWLSLAAPNSPPTLIAHAILQDDTPATVAQAFAGLINVGTNLVWASAVGDQLTITARSMGVAGNGIDVQLGLSTDGQTLSTVYLSAVSEGGVDGSPYNLDTSDALNSTLIAAADYWRTDLDAMPRMNRAARDWHQAYFAALKSYGIEVVASFSMELMNGDPSPAVGIVQQYPDGSPVVLNTPSVQTNFSPLSTAFWTQAYLDMAGLQAAAGLTPYLQFGEVQWWYFPKASVGMPFYDGSTQQQFQAQYGVPMQTITSNTVDPSQYPNEMAFLPALIGRYTSAIRTAVQAKYPGARFEVLFPTDTNDTALNMLVNFATPDWTAANLTCLKTESFSFTAANNLDQSTYSFGVSAAKGFPNSQRSHLIGISDAWTSWMKEADLAQSAGLESVVLFALDQYCLIGYPPPPFVKGTRSQRLG